MREEVVIASGRKEKEKMNEEKGPNIYTLTLICAIIIWAAIIVLILRT